MPTSYPSPAEAGAAPAALETPAAPAGRLLKRALVAVAALVVAAGAYAVWGLPPDVETITAGRVYKSGTLPHETLLEEVQRYGVRTVIDLRETPEDVAAEGAALSTIGVDHISIPSSQVPKPEVVDRFLEVMDDESHYPVLIHCRHGYGRAQVFSAIYRMEYEGWENDAARRKTRSALRLPFSGFAEGEPKGKFLLSYQPTRAGASAASASE